MRKYFMCLVFALLISAAVWAETSVGLPFGVKLGGQEAIPSGVVGKIAEPVANDADLELAVETKDTVFVNFFVSDANGNVTNANSSAVEIIMVNAANKFKINQTMSKNSLKAGIYLANIMANNQTSRIVFTVK